MPLCRTCKTVDAVPPFRFCEACINDACRRPELIPENEDERVTNAEILATFNAFRQDR